MADEVTLLGGGDAPCSDSMMGNFFSFTSKERPSKAAALIVGKAAGCGGVRMRRWWRGDQHRINLVRGVPRDGVITHQLPRKKNDLIFRVQPASLEWVGFRVARRMQTGEDVKLHSSYLNKESRKEQRFRCR